MVTPILGIVIEPIPSKDGKTIIFETTVGYYKPGILFFKTPEIQETIRKVKMEEGYGVVFFEYRIYSRRKMLVSKNFYPQGYEWQTSPLLNIGIASPSDIRIQRYLEKEIPGYRIRTTRAPGKWRNIYLQKRGIRNRTPIPLRESINKLKAHMIGNYQSRIRNEIQRRRK